MAVQQKVSSLKNLSANFIKTNFFNEYQSITEDNIELIKNENIKTITEQINDANILKILAGIKIPDIVQSDTDKLLNTANNYIYLFAFKRKALYAYIAKKHDIQLSSCISDLTNIKQQLSESQKSNNDKNKFKEELNIVKNKLGNVLLNTTITSELSNDKLLTKLDNLSEKLKKLKEFAATSASLHFKALETDENNLAQ